VIIPMMYTLMNPLHRWKKPCDHKKHVSVIMVELYSNYGWYFM
jgi:hypothetical protein